MQEVLFENKGVAGVITLNRPQALNALNLNMVRLITAQLSLWEADKSLHRILIKGAGEKAYCAGGDIRALHDFGKAKQYEEALSFWREEYLLNIIIKNYPKPIVSLVDGIVMGGGVGLAMNGTHVVAGERFIFAMPEVGIGFFPDVGGSYFLSRMPFETGTYAALTAARFKQGDAFATGLVTHTVKSAYECEEALTKTSDIDTLLKPFAIETTSKIMAHKASIKRAFAHKTVEEIVKVLEKDAANSDSFALETLETMKTKSPTSMKLALQQLCAGEKLDFKQVMAMEFRIVTRILQGHDFYEGVRAVIIDKDNAPKWFPNSLKDVKIADIDSYFQPISHELLS